MFLDSLQAFASLVPFQVSAPEGVQNTSASGAEGTFAFVLSSAMSAGDKEPVMPPVGIPNGSKFHADGARPIRVVDISGSIDPADIEEMLQNGSLVQSDAEIEMTDQNGEPVIIPVTLLMMNPDTMPDGASETVLVVIERDVLDAIGKEQATALFNSVAMNGMGIEVQQAAPEGVEDAAIDTSALSSVMVETIEQDSTAGTVNTETSLPAGEKELEHSPVITTGSDVSRNPDAKADAAAGYQRTRESDVIAQGTAYGITESPQDAVTNHPETDSMQNRPRPRIIIHSDAQVTTGKSTQMSDIDPGKTLLTLMNSLAGDGEQVNIEFVIAEPAGESAVTGIEADVAVESQSVAQSHPDAGERIPAARQYQRVETVFFSSDKNAPEPVISDQSLKEAAVAPETSETFPGAGGSQVPGDTSEPGVEANRPTTVERPVVQTGIDERTAIASTQSEKITAGTDKDPSPSVSVPETRNISPSRSENSDRMHTPGKPLESEQTVQASESAVKSPAVTGISTESAARQEIQNTSTDTAHAFSGGKPAADTVSGQSERHPAGTPATVAEALSEALPLPDGGGQTEVTSAHPQTASNSDELLPSVENRTDVNSGSEKTSAATGRNDGYTKIERTVATHYVSRAADTVERPVRPDNPPAVKDVPASGELSAEGVQKTVGTVGMDVPATDSLEPLQSGYRVSGQETGHGNPDLTSPAPSSLPDSDTGPLKTTVHRAATAEPVQMAGHDAGGQVESPADKAIPSDTGREAVSKNIIYENNTKENNSASEFAVAEGGTSPAQSGDQTQAARKNENASQSERYVGSRMDSAIKNRVPTDNTADRAGIQPSTNERQPEQEVHASVHHVSAAVKGSQADQAQGSNMEGDASPVPGQAAAETVTGNTGAQGNGMTFGSETPERFSDLMAKDDNGKAAEVFDLDADSSGRGFAVLDANETQDMAVTGAKKAESAAAPYYMDGVDEEQVVQTIVRGAIMMTRNGKSSAVITLEPPNLGKMHLDIVTERSTVTGKILVESAEVRDLVQNNMAQLREHLAQSGLMVESFDVQVGHNGGTDSWARNETFRMAREFAGRSDGTNTAAYGSTSGIKMQTGGQARSMSPYARSIDVMI